MYLRLTILVISLIIASSFASSGDSSQYFQQCLRLCFAKNCTSHENFSLSQPWILKLTAWSCENECTYQCMWNTELHYNGNLKFYGKWPFIRVLGLQEIVSVVASILNLITNVYMLRYIRKKLHPSLPMFHFWVRSSYFSINAWFWSAVFHARDTPFTEKLDYFGALSLVMSLFYVFIVRITYGYSRFHRNLFMIMICYFIGHCSYMSFIKFDYGYNMNVNLLFGISNSLGVITWWLAARKRLPHLYKLAICIIATMFWMSFEILDFSPIFYLVDSHSIWHLGTAPIPLLMYRFVIDDCLYLQKSRIKLI